MMEIKPQRRFISVKKLGTTTLGLVWGGSGISDVPFCSSRAPDCWHPAGSSGAPLRSGASCPLQCGSQVGTGGLFQGAAHPGLRHYAGLFLSFLTELAGFV